MPKRLILVDDSESFIDSFQRSVAKWGGSWEIVSTKGFAFPETEAEMSPVALANAVCEYIAPYLDENVAAVLVDLVWEVPKSNTVYELLGIEIGRRLRSMSENVPLILFTVKEEPDDFSRLSNEDFDGYLSKSRMSLARNEDSLRLAVDRARDKRERFYDRVGDHVTRMLDEPDIASESACILHLSDIHYGFTLDALDRRSVFDSTLRALMRDVERRYAREGIPEPEIIVVSGDITNRGSIEGYSHARGFLSALGGELGIPHERIIIVPGNHDVHRGMSRYSAGLNVYDEALEAEGEHGPLFPFRLAMFKEFFDEFYNGTHVFWLEPSRCYTVFDLSEKYRLVFVGLNSCERVDHSREWRDHPYISLDALAAAGRSVKERGLDGRQLLRIAVWHHPQLFEKRNEPQYHQRFLGELAGLGVTCYLHGHVHQALHDVRSVAAGSSVVRAFGAGSLSAPGADRSENWPNHYEVLFFDWKGGTCTVHSRGRVGEEWVALNSFEGGKSQYEFTLDGFEV